MNYKYNCLNPIAEVGLSNLDEKYQRTENFAEADAVFVRSAKMDELVPGDNLLAVARQTSIVISHNRTDALDEFGSLGVNRCAVCN